MAKKKIATAEDWERWRDARRRLEAVVARGDARERERAERDAERRARLRRLTFGLLGR